MTGHRVAVVKMGIRGDVECDHAAGIEPQSEMALRGGLFDPPELAIGHVTLGIRRGGLYTIPHGKRALHFAIQRERFQPAWVVPDSLARFTCEDDAFLVRLYI